MTIQPRTCLVGASALAVIFGIFGCLPFPLGDPAKSQVDPRLDGYWMVDSGDERELIAMFPFDEHTYVLEDLKLKHVDDKWQPQGPPQLFKAWLTNIKNDRFLTLEFLQQRLPRDPSEQKVYPALRLTLEGDSIMARMVNSDSTLIKSAKSAAEIETIIAKELNNPDLYSGDGNKFRRLDAERDKEMVQLLANN